MLLLDLQKQVKEVNNTLRSLQITFTVDIIQRITKKIITYNNVDLTENLEVL